MRSQSWTCLILSPKKNVVTKLDESAPTGASGYMMSWHGASLDSYKVFPSQLSVILVWYASLLQLLQLLLPDSLHSED